MSDHEQERLSEETIHTILQATVGWEANSFAGKVHRIINQLRDDLKAAQQQLEMHRIQDESSQPCAECEAYYALQARIDAAPEYWAHFTPCSHVSIFRDTPRLSKEKSAIWEPGCRDVRVKLLEIPEPPIPEPEQEKK